MVTAAPIKLLQQLTAATNSAGLDAVSLLAKRLHDWPLLKTAVDQKMGDQAEYLGWWDENVRPAGQGRNNAARGYFSVSEAEAQTGIAQQQVSRWRKRLADPEAYRAAMVA